MWVPKFSLFAITFTSLICSFHPSLRRFLQPKIAAIRFAFCDHIVDRMLHNLCNNFRENVDGFDCLPCLFNGLVPNV